MKEVTQVLTDDLRYAIEKAARSLFNRAMCEAERLSIDLFEKFLDDYEGISILSPMYDGILCYVPEEVTKYGCYIEVDELMENFEAYSRREFGFPLKMVRKPLEKHIPMWWRALERIDA